MASNTNNSRFDQIIEDLVYERIFFRNLPDEAKVSVEFALRAINSDKFQYEEIPILFSHFSVKIQNNKRVIIAAFQRNAELLNWIPEEIKQDKEFILMILKSRKYVPQSLCSIIQKYFTDDEHIAYEAIRISGNFYHNISERLKRRKSLFLLAIANGLDTPNSYSHFKNDREVVDLIIEWLGGTKMQISKKNVPFDFISDSLLSQKEICLKLINACPQAVRIIPDTLLDDKEVVVTSIKLNKTFFKDHLESFINNQEIIIEGVINDYRNYRLLPGGIKHDYELLLALFKRLPFNTSFRNMEKYLYEINEYPHEINDILCEVPDKYFSDYELIVTILEKYTGNGSFINSGYYDKVPDELKERKEVVLRILLKSFPREKEISYESHKSPFKSDNPLKSIEWYYYNVIKPLYPVDRDIHLQLIKHNPQCLRLLPSIFTDDVEIAFLAIIQDSAMMEYASTRLKNNIAFVQKLLTESVSNPQTIFAHCTKKVQENLYIVRRIIDREPLTITMVSDKIKSNRSILNKAILNYISPTNNHIFHSETEKYDFLNKIGVKWLDLEFLIKMCDEFRISDLTLQKLFPQHLNKIPPQW